MPAPSARAGTRRRYERIPLLTEDGDVDAGTEESFDRSVGPGAVDLVELLVGEILQPRHEREAKQVAEPEERSVKPWVSV